jgi:hypothetical protein
MGRIGISTRCSLCNTGYPHSTLKYAECVKKTLCMYPSNKIIFTFFLAIYNFQLNCKIGQRLLSHPVVILINDFKNKDANLFYNDNFTAKLADLETFLKR